MSEETNIPGTIARYGLIGCMSLLGAIFACCCAMPMTLLGSQFAGPQPVLPSPPVAPAALAGTPAPFDGGCWQVTSPFGWRVGTRGFPWHEWHGGVDLVRCDGQTLHAPVAAFQDGKVFSIDLSPNLYQGLGQEVEIVNEHSYEEIPILWTVGHLAPYRVEGRVMACQDERCTRTAPVANVGVYLCRWVPDGDGARCSDPIRSGSAGGGQVWPCRDLFGVPRDPERWIFPPTDAQGRWCFEVGLPAAFDVVLLPRTLPGHLEPISPERHTVDFPGAITLDAGGLPHAQDAAVDFYLYEPPPEPTPTPTPTPTPAPGEGAGPAARPAGGPWIPEVVRRHPGWGPPLDYGTEVRAYQTVLGYLGDTGRQTGPHLHLEGRYLGVWQDPQGNVRHYGSWIYRREYYRPTYPDGTAVEDRYLVLPHGVPFTGNFDPLQFLPHGTGERGSMIVNPPPPGDPLAGTGVYWRPAALWDDDAGGGRYSWSYRWFEFLGFRPGCGAWFGDRCGAGRGADGGTAPPHGAVPE